MLEVIIGRELMLVAGDGVEKNLPIEKFVESKALPTQLPPQTQEATIALPVADQKPVIW